MADQVSPWRDAVTDRPDADAVVLVCTIGGSLLTGWITGGGEWQAIYPTEAMPYTRRKPRDAASDPPAHWMPIPTPPWDSTRTQR